MEFNLSVPENWVLIDRDDYANLGIEEDEDIKCLSAYTVNSDENMSVICFFDFEDYDLEFLSDYDETLDEMNDINDEDDLEADDNVPTVKNVYHGYLDDYDKVVYININKIQIQDDLCVYSIQIFVEREDDDEEGLLCVQCSINNLDENDPLNSLLNLAFVKDAIELVI